MCGIAGVIRWEEEPIDADVLGMLLVGNEHRGNDASGIVIQQEDGGINTLKNDEQAWKFVSTRAYKDFIEEHLLPTSRAVLLHARAATGSASPRDNKNNHPLFAGHSAVIHNGVIRNDDDLFKRYNLKREAETDTDIIRAIIDDKGLNEEAIKRIAQCAGSGAIAAVHPAYKDTLLLIRSGNPLVLADTGDFWYFSSEKNTLHKALRAPYESRGAWFGRQKPDAGFSNFPQHTAWIIGPNGVETHAECHICTGDYHEPWRRVYDEYAERQEKWNRIARPASETGKMKPAWCVRCKRVWQIPDNAISYSSYTCPARLGGCGQALWMPLTQDLESVKERVN